jgi:hypothetical protein
MATTQVNSILSRAATLIQDATNVRWPQDELLGWLNDGQREVVLHKPEASVKNTSVSLTSGSTKQTIPSDGILLLDVTRNMGAAGTTAGNAIRLTTREVLDAQKPTWHSDANALGYVQHYIYDPRDPKTFYVYPKAPSGAWFAEVVYSAAPTDCEAGNTIQIDDIYANALLDYVLYRAYSKDAEYAANAALAVAHYQAFANAIGLKTQNDLSRNPNSAIGNAAYNPTIPHVNGQ